MRANDLRHNTDRPMSQPTEQEAARDRLWCKALLLEGAEAIHRVTTRFLLLRDSGDAPLAPEICASIDALAAHPAAAAPSDGAREAAARLLVFVTALETAGYITTDHALQAIADIRAAAGASEGEATKHE